MSLNNYHTHSRYCDGRDRPKAMIRRAIALGCEELGFSGHAYVDFDDCCMTPEGTEAYKREIRRLKEKYADKIRILLGVEQDYYSPLPTEDYEYVIGSVHYLQKDGKYLTVDYTREKQIRIVREYYGGDYYAFIEQYYAMVGEIYDKTHCDIVGHFDLVTKFNEDGSLFDTSHPRYRAAALAALDRLCACPVIFEVNTGAIARGYRKTPYPENWLLDELRRRKMPLLLCSDCHDRRFLLCGMDELKQKIPEAREKLFG